eukprot:5388090-Amphidinium_carterae.1
MELVPCSDNNNFDVLRHTEVAGWNRVRHVPGVKIWGCTVWLLGPGSNAHHPNTLNRQRPSLSYDKCPLAKTV